MERSQLFAQFPELAHHFRTRMVSGSRLAHARSLASWRSMTASKWELRDPDTAVLMAQRARRHLVANWMRHREVGSPVRHDMARLIVMGCYLIQARKKMARGRVLQQRGPWAAMAL